MSTAEGKPPVVARKAARWIIVLVIALAAGFLIVFVPAVVKVFASARIATQVSSSNQDVREVDLAVIRFADANGNTYPKFSDSFEVAAAIKPYLKEARLQDFAAGCVWNTRLSGRSLSELNDPYRTWVLYSKHPFGMRGNVIGYADGQVRTSMDSETATITSASKELFRK